MKGVAFLTQDTDKLVLDNGLTVIVKEFKPSSVINLAVWVKVGSVNEDECNAGVSHYIEHMLFKGTKKRKVGEIAKEIHSVGGYLNAFTHFECTCYWIVLPSRFLDTALDVQADAIINPLFERLELIKEKKVILEELKMYEDRPESFCFEKLMELAYLSHNYRRPIIGYENSLNRMKREDIVDYYNTYYQPGNMVVTLVGDVRKEEGISKISKIFSKMRPKPLNVQISVPEPTQKRFKQVEYFGDIQRTHVQFAFHIPYSLHNDLPACRVLAAILGEGRSSRLFRSLKEVHRVVDSVESGVFSEKDPGLLYIGTVLDTKKISKMDLLLWKEIKKVQNELISGAELSKVQHMLESYYVFSQETVEGQGRILGFYELLGDYGMAGKYLERIYSVTREDVKRVACKYLCVENSSEIIYNPKTANKRDLEQFGAAASRLKISGALRGCHL